MPASLEAQVGRNLYRIRRSKKLTQEALADLVGMYSNHLGRIERGEENITLKTVRKLCKALRIPPARLFYGIHHFD